MKVKTFSIRAFLVYVLAAQIAVTHGTAPFALAAESSKSGPQSPQGPKDIADTLVEEGASSPEARKAQKTLENLATEIEGAAETDLPNNTPNAFFLAGQTLTTSGRTYDLSRYNIELPTITVNDFDKQIFIEVDRQARTLSFVKRHDDVEIARQTIVGVDVVHYSRDAELLQFIDSNGQMYATDMVFARNREILFKIPIPIFKLGPVPDAALSQIENVKSAFITRGFVPPETIHPDALIPEIDANLVTAPKSNTQAPTFNLDGQWKMGPYILYTEKPGGRGAGRELFGIYHRAVTKEKIKAGFGILHSLAYTISPEGQADSAKIFEDKEIAKTAVTVTKRLDPLTREAFSAYRPNVLNEVAMRCQSLDCQLADPTDKLLYSEWKTAAQELHDIALAESAKPEVKAAAETGNLGAYWQQLSKKHEEAIKKSEKTMFQRLVSPFGLKLIAGLTAGYGTIFTAHFFGGSIVDGHGPIWAVHMANSIYDIMPDVLRDAEYRVTMFKGMHFLSSFILVNYIVGTIVGKAKGWDFRKSLATIGVRVAAAIQMNFFARLAQLSRQPSFIMALRAGVNPLRNILPNSTEGQMVGLHSSIRPGVNNPFVSAAELRSKTELDRAVVEARVKVKQRRHVLAAKLADLVVAEKFGLDPITLIMAERGDLQGEDYDDLLAEVQRLKSNTVIFNKWKRLADELYFSLRRVSDFKEDFAHLSQKDIVDHYRFAKTVAQKISRRNKFGTLAAAMRLKWNQLTQGHALKGIGNFGYSEYNFLKNVDISRFVGEQGWEQFAADFVPSVVQIPLVGHRAVMDVPLELAHSENYFGWTTPGHMSDMGNQYAIYGISVPANLAQVYGDKAKEVKETRYQPIELITHESVVNPEGFIKGLWYWMKGAANLHEAGYGYLFIKDFIRRLKAIQLYFVMDFLTRVFLAHQPAAAAIPAFITSRLLGEWKYAWWWKPVTRGNQIYKGRLEDLNNQFNDAKIKISQGVRLKDDAMWIEGNDTLRELYFKNSQVIGQLAHTIRAVEMTLEIPTQDRLKAEELIESSLGAVVRLHLALQTHDKSQISEAYNNLVAQYDIGVDLAAQKMDAETLLEFSIKNPPFKNSVNPKVSLLLNLFGAFITTYLGTNFFVVLLRDHSWGDLVLNGALFSATMYSSLYFAQRGIDNLANTWKYIKLRQQLSQAALDMATAKHQKFKSLEDYATWLKESPSSSEFIRHSPHAELVNLLRKELNAYPRGENGFLAKLNANQRPSLDELRQCAKLLQGTAGETQFAPKLTWSEKMQMMLKGLFQSPVK